ncbi:histidine phosphatase family protein [Haladaptatus sp. CMSO5]|uniref:histidine phosphatase family protein n=1 Tax=Haladaptatus sp. CMSO5 TaxID=3120514 RepID=UPI002FCDF87E
MEAIGETFQRAIDAVWADWDFAWPGGESNHEAQARGVSALEAVLYAHAGDHVVGIHGNLLTLILNHYDDRFDVEFWRNRLSIPDCYRIEFSGGELHSSERLPAGQT